MRTELRAHLLHEIEELKNNCQNVECSEKTITYVREINKTVEGMLNRQKLGNVHRLLSSAEAYTLPGYIIKNKIRLKLREEVFKLLSRFEFSRIDVAAKDGWEPDANSNDERGHGHGNRYQRNYNTGINNNNNNYLAIPAFQVENEDRETASPSQVLPTQMYSHLSINRPVGLSLQDTPSDGIQINLQLQGMLNAVESEGSSSNSTSKRGRDYTRFRAGNRKKYKKKRSRSRSKSKKASPNRKRKTSPKSPGKRRRRNRSKRRRRKGKRALSDEREYDSRESGSSLHSFSRRERHRRKSSVTLTLNRLVTLDRVLQQCGVAKRQIGDVICEMTLPLEESNDPVMETHRNEFELTTEKMTSSERMPSVHLIPEFVAFASSNQLKRKKRRKRKGARGKRSRSPKTKKKIQEVPPEGEQPSLVQFPTKITSSNSSVLEHPFGIPEDLNENSGVILNIHKDHSEESPFQSTQSIRVYNNRESEVSDDSNKHKTINLPLADHDSEESSVADVELDIRRIESFWAPREDIEHSTSPDKTDSSLPVDQRQSKNSSGSSKRSQASFAMSSRVASACASSSASSQRSLFGTVPSFEHILQNTDRTGGRRTQPVTPVLPTLGVAEQQTTLLDISFEAIGIAGTAPLQEDRQDSRSFSITLDRSAVSDLLCSEQSVGEQYTRSNTSATSHNGGSMGATSICTTERNDSKIDEEVSGLVTESSYQSTERHSSAAPSDKSSLDEEEYLLRRHVESMCLKLSGTNLQKFDQSAVLVNWIETKEEQERLLQQEAEQQRDRERLENKRNTACVVIQRFFRRLLADRILAGKIAQQAIRSLFTTAGVLPLKEIDSFSNVDITLERDPLINWEYPLRHFTPRPPQPKVFGISEESESYLKSIRFHVPKGATSGRPSRYRKLLPS